MKRIMIINWKWDENVFNIPRILYKGAEKKAFVDEWERYQQEFADKPWQDYVENAPDFLIVPIFLMLRNNKTSISTLSALLVLLFRSMRKIGTIKKSGAFST